MIDSRTKEWLNWEIPNKASLAGSIATAAMVGIAADVQASTVFATIIIWAMLDRIAYEVLQK